MAEKVAEVVKKRSRPVRVSELEGEGEVPALTEEDYEILEKEYNIKRQKIDEETKVTWGIKEDIESEIKLADKRIEELTQKQKMLEEKISKKLDLIHKYNETKDIAQFLMGKLAEMEQCTVKKIHEKMGVADLPE